MRLTDPGRIVGPLLVAAALLFSTPVIADQPVCDVDRAIVLAGLNWDSNAFHTAIASRILKDGFGCRVEIATGSTRPLFKSMVRGDVDVTMELWKDNLPKLWPAALSRGQVVELGINYADAVQGWFVPRYAVEGPTARAPGLTAVQDLARYKQAFADPEDRTRGRFYNCMLGWGCEPINTAKLKAYGLNKHFTNFRPSSGKALIKAIERHYRKGEAFLTYYWGPTWVLGTFDLVMLTEPPFDPEIWEDLVRSPDPTAATAYPTSEISIAVNAEFARNAPLLSEFLSKYRTSGTLISRALAEMKRTDSRPDQAAISFLKTNDTWHDWVATDVRERVLKALP